MGSVQNFRRVRQLRMLWISEILWYFSLTYWGRVTHTCVSKLTTIGSDNGLSPGRRQAIIWTNAGILLIGPLGINFSEILIEINTFSFNKMHLKMSSAKWRLFPLSLNELRHILDELFFHKFCHHWSRWWLIAIQVTSNYLNWLWLSWSSMRPFGDLNSDHNEWKAATYTTHTHKQTLVEDK